VFAFGVDRKRIARGGTSRVGCHGASRVIAKP
jgi:hypothetical protein